MSNQLFVVNKTDINLQFKGGYFYVGRKGFKPISEAEKDHPDFIYALEKGWIEITDKEPPAPVGLKPVETISSVEPLRGLTAEELKAQMAKAEKKEETSSEPIGSPAEQEASEPKKEGGDAEEQKAEAAPKRGRKNADKGAAE